MRVWLLLLCTVSWPAFSAQEYLAIQNRVPASCELQEKDVVPAAGSLHRTAQSYVQRLNEDSHLGSGKYSVYRRYLGSKYHVDSSLQGDSLEEAAFTAALEDLPEKLRKTFAGLKVSENTNDYDCSDPRTLMTTYAAGAGDMGICKNNIKAAKMYNFTDLKTTFLHELGHAYAVTHGNADLKQDWLKNSKWTQTGKKSYCYADPHCNFYSYTDAQNKTWSSEQRTAHTDPGFVSQYATTAPTTTSRKASRNFVTRKISPRPPKITKVSAGNTTT